MDTTTSTDALAGNSSLEDGTDVAEPMHQPLSPTELYSLVAMLSMFSVTGTIGNAIAFYVFSVLKKQVTLVLRASASIVSGLLSSLSVRNQTASRLCKAYALFST